jgi:hypothetical protein
MESLFERKIYIYIVTIVIFIEEEGNRMDDMKFLKKIVIILAIFLLIFPSVQGALNTNSVVKEKFLNEKNTPIKEDTDHFTNCIIVVFGKCDTVQGPLVWLFGFYCPIFKRNFRVMASGRENESLNAMVIGRGIFATYYSIENVIIDINRARGVLYYFGKSLLINGNNILAFCKAADIFITTS